MKKQLLPFLLFIGLHTIYAQSMLIPDYKNTANQYNYLIVSPVKFLSGAEKLAQFRQSFSGYKAGVVILDSIYARFDSAGRKSYEKLWWGLKYAYKSWSVPPTMIVLIGSDSISFNSSDSTFSNCGYMPAVAYDYYYLYTDSNNQVQPLYIYTSDDYYSFLDDSTTPDLKFDDKYFKVTVGRIPCDSAEQCERYVQKVINFENNKQKTKSWFNSAMVVSDDNMQGAVKDGLNVMHLDMAENCANNLLRSWFVTKIVGCAFTADSTYSKPDAEDSVVNAINNGNLWSIYIGHATPFQWSDEIMLSCNDAGRLKNDSMPSVFLSFSCANGDYIKSFNKSMCKQFLFLDNGGALAYIGATAPTYVDNNSELMKTFFSVFNENQQIPISEVLMTSKIIVHDLNSTCYVFLGDPALKLSDSRIDLNLTQDNSNLYFSCRSSHMTITSGNFDVRIYKRDSVSMGSSHYCLDSLVSRQTGTFSNGTFSAALTDTNVRVVAYVWNELGEGRMDSSFLLFTIPVVVQVNQKIDAPMLKIVSGKLILKAASLRNTLIRITALTLNGRSVINKEISMSTPEITVDPKGMGLAAGTYLIKLSTVNGIFIQRMTISK